MSLDYAVLATRVCLSRAVPAPKELDVLAALAASRALIGHAVAIAISLVPQHLIEVHGAIREPFLESCLVRLSIIACQGNEKYNAHLVSMYSFFSLFPRL